MPEENGGYNPFAAYGEFFSNIGQNVSNWFQNIGQGVSDWWQNSPLMPNYWQSKLSDWLGITGAKDSISSATKQGEIAYTESGIPYDKTNIDSEINALAQEYAYKRDDQAYDRLIVALKRNGINPAIALSNSASPMSSDTAYRSNYNMTDKDQINSALKAGSILAVIIGLLSRSK